MQLTGEAESADAQVLCYTLNRLAVPVAKFQSAPEVGRSLAHYVINHVTQFGLGPGGAA